MKIFQITIGITCIFLLLISSRILMAGPGDGNLHAGVQLQVTGKVTDSKGNLLPGVSVLVKGHTGGSSTDANGLYRLRVDATDTLVFSLVGLASKTVPVNGQTKIDVTLEDEQNELNEVVVIGYQSVKKRDLTGATGVINTGNTQKIVARSMPEALQGMSPGISVRNGGAPGQEAVVNIRGLSTFSGNANPLYVIDGMLADANTTVNPSDVASIQVLKDASAAAIYGSRAANGVVIITTKKGKGGVAAIAVSSRYSLSTIPGSYHMMDAPAYVAMNKAAYAAGGFVAQPAVAAYDGGLNTDWSDELLRTGIVQDYNASISGGGENSNYLLSGGYFKDKGTLIARDFDRMSFRVNTEATKGRLKVGENFAVSSSSKDNPMQGGNFAGNPWYDMWTSLPIIPVRSDALVTTDNPGGWGYGSNGTVNTFSRNQVALANITSVHGNYVKLLGNAYLDFKIFNGLNYRLNAGLENSFDKVKTIRRDGSWYQNQSPDVSQLNEDRSQFLSYLFEHTLNYDYTFGKHRLNGVVGYTQQTTRTDNNYASRNNLANFGGEYYETINSATGDMTSAGRIDKYLIDSYLGRINYAYDDKYLATLTFRSDKDSRFSPDHRVGNFPSAALAWRLSRESFFKADWVSDLKIRGSYGVLGAANLTPYQFTGYLNQAPGVVLGPQQVVFSGATQAKLAYEDLKWESKATTNLGLDASLFNNRFSLAFDVFRSVSKDVLVGQPLPGYLGNLQGDPLVNIGSIENKGIELDLAYHPVANGNFKWDISGNVSVIRNKVLKLGNLGIDTDTGLPRSYITSGNTRTQVGRAVGEYYVLITDGIFQNAEEVSAGGSQAAYAQPGDIRYKNLVDGGTNDDINDKDRAFAGSPWPKLTTGLQFNASFKSFSLTAQLYGAFGQMLYNDVLREIDSYGYSNYRKDLNPWTPDNRNTDDPRMGVNYAVGGSPADRGITSNARGNSDRWLESGSFLRLRNLELGYNLPQSFLNKARFKNARVFVSAQNLFTITGYSGLDPDVVGANVNLEPGVDNGNYPSSRIVSFGIDFGF
ncbi:TonB-linked outer membrane protein, SusC/RagA family [bacterium A37T11]|nr:TonB-linked outer membrane protein, SusC/RagA family [bacterium A37T11]